MHQLTRKLSQQATFTSSPSILAIDDQEIFVDNLIFSNIGYKDFILIISSLVVIYFDDKEKGIAFIFNLFICQLIFITAFPRFFLHFYGIFTFGEGSVVLQSIITFIYLTLKEMIQVSTWTTMSIFGLNLISKYLIVNFILLNWVALHPKLQFIRKLPILYEVILSTIMVSSLMAITHLKESWNIEILKVLFDYFVHNHSSGIILVCFLILSLTLDFMDRYNLSITFRTFYEYLISTLCALHYPCKNITHSPILIEFNKDCFFLWVYFLDTF